MPDSLQQLLLGNTAIPQSWYLFGNYATPIFYKVTELITVVIPVLQVMGTACGDRPMWGKKLNGSYQCYN